MKRVLAATDGSAGADRAADVAAELARALDGTLLILTAIDERSDGGIDQLARSEGDRAEALDLLVSQTLYHAKARASQLGAPRIETLSGWGDATQSIIDCAHQHQIDALSWDGAGAHVFQDCCSEVSRKSW